MHECQHGHGEIEVEGDVSGWKPVLFAALAGGMAWGIRGQYGHETGAMLAGLLVSLTLTLLLCPRAPLSGVVRAVALATVAMGYGGTMTYGQTLGLTQSPALVGNWEALRWGLLGCLIKGGIWIGLAGVFLGMGLSGLRYRALEMLMLMLGMLGAYFIGHTLLNSPFHPAERELPALYFSQSWYWEPDGDVEPRPEMWGGLLFALLTAIGYLGVYRRDILARNLALWGMLGGGLGFPLGQCWQACHAWNREAYTAGIWEWLDPLMNWWNMMEISFGTIMAACLGLGLWLNRRRIRFNPENDEARIAVPVEVAMLAVHIGLLAAVEFLAIPVVDAVYDLGLIMGILPMVAIAGGRYARYVVMMPIMLLPYAGKTVKGLVYEEATLGMGLGWAVYFVLPMIVAIGFAIWLHQRAKQDRPARSSIAIALLLCCWLYFSLNYAVFRFPWPWAEWTGRTPSGIINTVQLLGLTLLGAIALRAGKDPEGYASNANVTRSSA